MKKPDNFHHHRFPDHEIFDKIALETRIRYKTSDLSGDEWRTSAVVSLTYKGRLVAENAYRDMETAMKLLPSFLTKVCESGDYDHRYHETSNLCDQIGCAEPAVSIYRLKQLFDSSGHRLDMGDYPTDWVWYRQFCQRHLQRGDCSREDSDDNYTVVSGPGPSDAKGWEDDESPAITA